MSFSEAKIKLEGFFLPFSFLWPLTTVNFRGLKERKEKKKRRRKKIKSKRRLKKLKQ